ncbi:MAG: hypothetical protein KDA79_03285 [Planctomycetaceae bacterium]|nr:hypothetical protein [Planctomycetaceae bacterium]
MNRAETAAPSEEQRSPRRSLLPGLAATLLLLPCLVWTSLVTGQAGAFGESATDDRGGKSRVMTVAEFLERKSEWRRFAVLNLTVRIEGRYSSLSGRRMKMQKLDMTVEMQPGKRLPSLAGRSRTVEVAGRLVQDGEDYRLELSSVRELPPESERLTILKAGVDPGSPADWYRLAEWASSRGTFFDDDELKAEARQLREKGFDVEHAAAAGDSQQLRKLIVTADQLKIEARKVDRLRHELQLQLMADHRTTGMPQLPALVELAATSLPGALIPVEQHDAELLALYREAPLRVYDNASRPDRARINRDVYARLLLEQFSRQVRQDGSNAARTAAAVSEKLPDYPQAAEPYRDMDLTWRLKSMEDLTRDEAMALAGELRERQRDDDAKKGLDRWIQARKAEYAAEGTAGLVRVAALYRSVAGDPEMAAKTLFAAAEQNPDSREVRQSLEELGYRRHGNRWVWAEEVGALPVDPVQQAIREGRVVEGMSPGEVVQSLGRPDAVTRLVSADAVDVIWTFGVADARPLTVRFAGRMPRIRDLEVSQVTPLVRVRRTLVAGDSAGPAAVEPEAVPVGGNGNGNNAEGGHGRKVRLPPFRFAVPR